MANNGSLSISGPSTSCFMYFYSGKATVTVWGEANYADGISLELSGLSQLFYLYWLTSCGRWDGNPKIYICRPRPELSLLSKLILDSLLGPLDLLLMGTDNTWERSWARIFAWTFWATAPRGIEQSWLAFRDGFFFCLAAHNNFISWQTSADISNVSTLELHLHHVSSFHALLAHFSPPSEEQLVRVSIATQLDEDEVLSHTQWRDCTRFDIQSCLKIKRDFHDSKMCKLVLTTWQCVDRPAVVVSRILPTPMGNLR